MNIFDLFLKKIINIPLWVKQILYIRLLVEMRENFCEDFVRTYPDKIFAGYMPILTFCGQSELQDKKNGFDSNIYNFLQNCKDGYSIIDITVNSFYSLEETAKYFEFCLEQNLIEKPNKQIEAEAGYLAGKYRVGEYLLHCGKISEKQLKTAIEENKKNPQKKMGEILTAHEFVPEKSLKALFAIKEEAKKRFIIDYNKIPKIEEIFPDKKSKYENEIKNLTNENKKLRKQLEQLLTMVTR